MSQPDPPAPDLGTLDAATRQRLENVRYPQRAMAMDVRTILAAYDRQTELLETVLLKHQDATARLAAVEGERDHAIANLVQAHDRWGAEEQRVTRQVTRLAALREWAVAERDEWSGRNADRYWQMTRVVNEIDGAVGAGEEDGCAPS